ncbi:MAG: hypothetical protein IJ523_07650 [Succinivibrionaceae bacterium]|nr:hypothetical protein [Succinivibrionaceae bacterium]
MKRKAGSARKMFATPKRASVSGIAAAAGAMLLSGACQAGVDPISVMSSESPFTNILCLVVLGIIILSGLCGGGG